MPRLWAADAPYARARVLGVRRLRLGARRRGGPSHAAAALHRVGPLGHHQGGCCEGLAVRAGP
eukprot:4692045-Alexandrium_andersonii.AAC.1